MTSGDTTTAEIVGTNVFAKLFRYELTGDEVECDTCGIAKAKRANVSKTMSVKTTNSVSVSMSIVLQVH